MGGQSQNPTKRARRSTAAATAAVTLALVFATFGATAIYVDMNAADRTQAFAKQKAEQAKDAADCLHDYTGSEIGPNAHLYTMKPAPECVADKPSTPDLDRVTDKALDAACEEYDAAIESLGDSNPVKAKYVQDPVAEAAGAAPDCPQEPAWV